MNHKAFHYSAILLFIIIAAIHLLRIFSQWEVNVNGWVAPLWLSWVAVLILGYFAYRSYKTLK